VAQPTGISSFDVDFAEAAISNLVAGVAGSLRDSGSGFTSRHAPA